MTRTLSTVLALGIVFVLAAGSAQADLILLESFDYGPQDNTTKFLKDSNNHDGGTGWADEWKEASGNGVRLDTVETTQPYPAGSPLTSVGSRIEDAHSGGSSQREMTNTINMNVEEDLYFSALVNWSTGAAFRAEFFQNTGPNFHVRWTPFDIDTSGNLKTGVFGLSSGSVSLTSGVDYLVVGKLDKGSNPDKAYLSVFQVSSPGSYLTEPTTWQISDSDTSGVVMDFFRITTESVGASTPASIIDEIRMGTTYADVVVPAPAALPAGLALLAMTACLRRRK